MNINDKYKDVNGRLQELLENGNTLVDKSIRKEIEQHLDRNGYAYDLTDYNSGLFYFNLKEEL